MSTDYIILGVSRIPCPTIWGEASQTLLLCECWVYELRFSCYTTRTFLTEPSSLWPPTFVLIFKVSTQSSGFHFDMFIHRSPLIYLISSLSLLIFNGWSEYSNCFFYFSKYLLILVHSYFKYPKPENINSFKIDKWKLCTFSCAQCDDLILWNNKTYPSPQILFCVLWWECLA